MTSRRVFALLMLLPGLCVAQVASLGIWTYISRVDMESANPGAGVAFRFKAGSAFADIYFYDAGRTWSEGTDSTEFREMLPHVRAELLMAEKQGVFTALQFGTSENVTIAGRHFHLQRMKYRRGATEYTSLMYLSGIRGKLIKFRVTAPDGVAGVLEEDAVALIESAFARQSVFEAPWAPTT